MAGHAVALLLSRNPRDEALALTRRLEKYLLGSLQPQSTLSL